MKTIKRKIIYLLVLSVFIGVGCEQNEPSPDRPIREGESYIKVKFKDKTYFFTDQETGFHHLTKDNPDFLFSLGPYTTWFSGQTYYDNQVKSFELVLANLGDRTIPQVGSYTQNSNNFHYSPQGTNGWRDYPLPWFYINWEGIGNNPYVDNFQTYLDSTYVLEIKVSTEEFIEGDFKAKIVDNPYSDFHFSHEIEGSFRINI